VQARECGIFLDSWRAGGESFCRHSFGERGCGKSIRGSGAGAPTLRNKLNILEITCGTPNIVWQVVVNNQIKRVLNLNSMYTLSRWNGILNIRDSLKVYAV
jgi:hypothetical protein